MIYLIPPFILSFVIAGVAFLLDLFISALFLRKRHYGYLAYLFVLDLIVMIMLAITQSTLGWALAFVASYCLGAIPILIIAILIGTKSGERASSE